MTKTGRWSAEDDAELRRMKEAKYPVDVIAIKLDRKYDSIVARWKWVNSCEEKKQRRREGINFARAMRRGDAQSSSPSFGARSSALNRPAPDLIAEAHKRLYAPRTISQQLLGDPPPGYSALDRKRQAVPA